jgi:D-alanyl-lipoteichoic acid acyltransferase DltB (MBOAT superfamily)
MRVCRPGRLRQPAIAGPAAYFFSFQIYCDFSGYNTDIAAVAARVLGFELTRNFFHRRFTLFHPPISGGAGTSRGPPGFAITSTFAGRRPCAGAAPVLHLAVVFLLSSLWHGAAWTFVVWGALHGLFLMVAHVERRLATAFCGA